MNQIDKPLWLPQKITKRKSSGSVSGYPRESNPSRGFVISEIIERHIKDTKPSSTNFLEVGVGQGADPIACPYEPYQIAAVFEKSSLEYRGLVVDKNKKVLDNLIDRTRLYYPLERYNQALPGEVIGWNDYLHNTGQRLRVIHQAEPQLVITDLFSFTIGMVRRDVLKEGVLVAEAPPRFVEKLRNGHVSVLQGDIAGLNLTPYGSFDIAACMNILCYLSDEEQQLAMYNIATNLKFGGVIIYNEDDRGPVTAQHGGWLNEAKLKDLRLEPATEIGGSRVKDGVNVLRRVR